MTWEYNKTNFDRNLAVVIGIDRYKNHPQIHRLRTPVNDAKALADVLEKYEYKPENVIRLLDEAATLTGLQTLLNDTLPNQLKPTKGDRLIFYFAGHGIPRNSQDGPKGYLVPQDADWQKEGSFLAMSEVYEALSKLECHHLLVILDCCFAGTFRWAGRRKIIPILETVRREHYDRFIRYPAWQVMTSAAHDQEALDVAKLAQDKRGAVADEKQELHSPFALALLSGLGENKADLIPDGVITAHELYVYLEQQVSKFSGERQRPGIYPMRLEYDRGEFVFTRPGFTSSQLKPAPLLNESNNPYRGLASFDEKHAHFFFGRMILVEELQRCLSQPNRSLTVVLGASGSGKSSLVKAGLIPDLRQESKWYILDPMRPDRFPFTALARAILPIAKPELIEQLSQLSFLDEVFKPKDKNNQDDSDEPTDAVFVKLAESWNSATPEAKLLLIADYFQQLQKLCRNSQEEKQFSQLYRAIFEKLESLSNRLQNEPQHLTSLIKKWSDSHPNAKLLLTIDQFEELITMSQESKTETHGGDETPDERAAEAQPWLPFLQVLREAIVQCSQQLHIVLTLRSDFEPRFLSSPLSTYWKDARFPVRAMNLDELRQAIEGPALKQALYFEPPELVGKLIDEVGQMPGALPLLSFTLSELYIKLYDRWTKDNASDRALRIKDYEELGGVAGALTRRATEEYDNLVRKFGEESGKAYQATMRRVMLRMVVIEGGGVARRRVPEPELAYSDAEESKRVEYVVDRLVEARLLVKGQEAGTVYVEPAHDFLVRGWDQLQKWIKNQQDDLALQQRLTVAANDWHNKNEQEKEHKTLLNILRQAETFFICKVQDWRLDRERRKQRKAESSKRSREKSVQYLWDDDPRLEQLKRILIGNNWFNRTEDSFVRESLIEQRRNSYRLIEIVTAVGVGLVGLTIAALYQAEVSSLREKAARAQLSLSSGSPMDGLILAIQATGESQDRLKQVVPQLQSVLPEAIHTVRERNILRGHQGWVISVAISHDGKYIATGSQDQTVRLWSIEGKLLNTFKGHQGWVNSVNFSPDGKYIATGSQDKTVRLWSIKGKLLNTFKGHQQEVYSVNFSPDGKYIATGSQDQTVHLWSSEGKLLKTFKGHQKGVRSVAFSPDGKSIVSGSEDNTVRLWSLEGKLLNTLKGHQGPVLSVSFSPSSRYLLSGSIDRTVRLWSIKGELLDTRSEHEDQVASVSFSPNGQYVISSSFDNSIRLWNFINGSLVELATLRGHEREVLATAFTPSGQFIVSGSGDQTVRVWSTDGQPNKLLKKTEDEPGKILSIAFSPDGKYIASGNYNSTLRLWTIQGDSLPLLPGHKDFISSVAFSPNGKYVISGSWDNTIRVWSIQDGWITTLKQPDKVLSVAFSPDGKYIISGSADKNVYLWSLERNQGKLLSIFKGHKLPVNSVAYSPNGKYIVSGSDDKTVRLWSAEGKLLKILEGHSARIYSVAFSPDSRYIVSGSIDSTIRSWSIKGELLNTLRGHRGWVYSVAFSPDGKQIVSGGQDGTVQLWSFDSNNESKNELQAVLKGHLGEVYSVAFSPKGKHIVSGSDANELRLWPNNNSKGWLQTACDNVHNHPIFKEPKGIALDAKNTCSRNAWRRKHL
ncbi:caspase family protein [Microcoleus sp. B3-A4]|uniref:nSTAND1 domain-containing NTPase n=1 Tax=Microcoleus sp. B3-A4 TaxID=2818653 RepID=UPI002FD3EA3E